MSAPNPVDEKPAEPVASSSSSAAAAANSAEQDVEMKSEEPVIEQDPVPDDVKNSTPEEIQTRVRLIDNDIKIMRS